MGKKTATKSNAQATWPWKSAASAFLVCAIAVAVVLYQRAEAPTKKPQLDCHSIRVNLEKIYNVRAI